MGDDKGDPFTACETTTLTRNRHRYARRRSARVQNTPARNAFSERSERRGFVLGGDLDVHTCTT